jgi:hypothetical protein
MIKFLDELLHVEFSKEDFAPWTYLYLPPLHRDAFTTPGWLILAEERHFLFLIYHFGNSFLRVACWNMYQNSAAQRWGRRGLSCSLFMVNGFLYCSTTINIPSIQCTLGTQQCMGILTSVLKTLRDGDNNVFEKATSRL